MTEPDDGFVGALVEPAARVTRARAAFRELPAAVRDHPELARWLASDLRRYWAVTRPLKDPEPKITKRDVDAVLTAIARLERALGRLPHDSLGSEAGDQMRQEVLEATGGRVTLFEAGHGSRHADYLALLTSMRVQVQRSVGGKRRPGPRGDHWRAELEELVTRDVADAGLRLTKSLDGVLARTLAVVYRAAGIKAQRVDFDDLCRLVDRYRLT